MSATAFGFDFYFAIEKDGEIHSIEEVRLYGSSDKFLAGRRQTYAKDGFVIRSSSREEYRAHHWKKPTNH